MKLALSISANAAADSLRRVSPRLSQLRSDFEQYKPSGDAYLALEVRISTAFHGQNGAHASVKDGVINAYCGLDFRGDLSPSGDEEFFRFVLGKVRDAIVASPLAVQDQDVYLSFVELCEM